MLNTRHYFFGFKLALLTRIQFLTATIGSLRRFCGRRISEEDPELMGVPRLIFHEVLFTRRYVECDTLFLRIEVGPHDSQRRFSDFDSNYWY